MFDLDKLISEAYNTKDTSFDSLVKMVEEMMVLQESLGFIKEEARIDSMPKEFKDVKIIWRPYVQMSEISWGSTAHNSADARDFDGDGEISQEERNPAREQLKRYLSAIPAGNIKQKIDSLNEFISRVDKDSSAIDGIGKAVSFMMFYRTLYDIINDFNAASAGFIFESFLAVLLDAKSGHQVPAAGAKTIADFIIYPKNQRVPISLKLYSEGGLKVGGSYVQLVNDLTGEFGTMQYIVIVKQSNKDKEVQKLKFYSFNFTLDNFAKILTLTGATGLDQMCLPQSIVKAYKPGDLRALRQALNTTVNDIAIASQRTIRKGTRSEFDPTGQFRRPVGRTEYDIDLQIPSRTKISLKPAFEAIEKSLRNDGVPMKEFMAKIGGTNIDLIRNAFLAALNSSFKVPSLNSNIGDLEIGQSQTSESDYAYTSKGKSKIKLDSKLEIFNQIFDILSDEQKQKTAPGYRSTKNNNHIRNLIVSVLNAGEEAQAASPQPEKGQDPRSIRVAEIYGERTPEQKQISVSILSDADLSLRDKKRILKLTAGYQGVGGEPQFELKTKDAFTKLYTPEYAGSLPYGAREDGSFAELSLVKQEVLAVCNSVLSSFNRNMTEALNGMQMLVDDMNAYVMSGLKTDKRAEAAVQDANIVKTSMDKQVQQHKTSEQDEENT